MKTGARHFKFINSVTGNAIYYYSSDQQANCGGLTEELEKVKTQVAIKNGVFVDTIYWEEMKDENQHETV